MVAEDYRRSSKMSRLYYITDLAGSEELYYKTTDRCLAAKTLVVLYTRGVVKVGARGILISHVFLHMFFFTRVFTQGFFSHVFLHKGSFHDWFFTSGFTYAFSSARVRNDIK